MRRWLTVVVLLHLVVSIVHGAAHSEASVPLSFAASVFVFVIKVDRPGSTALEPGGLAVLPAKMHHYAWVKKPTVVQLNLEGPFDLFYVNPTDGPQKSASTQPTH